MNPDTRVALIGALILTAYVTYSVIREWQKINACLAAERRRREDMLLADLDFACAEAVRLRERLDVLEARGLPDLAEMRAGGAS